MKGIAKHRRGLMIALAHLFIVSLSVSCGQYDSVGHGPYHLSTSNIAGGTDRVAVDFFLDEEVKEGVLTGWISGGGCWAWVDLCDGGYCETVFSDWVGPREYMFEVYSDESYVFDNYLEEFDLCYKESEWFQEPMSCQRLDCKHSKDDIIVILESECPADLYVAIDIEYFDERTPFKGCFFY